MGFASVAATGCTFIFRRASTSAEVVVPTFPLIFLRFGKNSGCAAVRIKGSEINGRV